MESLGVLICGYSREDARRIQSFLGRTLAAEVTMIGASPNSEEKIIDLLDGGPTDHFADEETKILMFLGFSEEQTRRVLQEFPSGDGGLKRPIFCMLTARNAEWPLCQLLEHLAEEHRNWSAKRRNSA